MVAARRSDFVALAAFVALVGFTGAEIAPAPIAAPTPANETNGKPPSPALRNGSHWVSCSVSSKSCCNPLASTTQYCIGGITCQRCGSSSCECPSRTSPVPTDSGSTHSAQACGPTKDNPLGICARPQRSDNFFLIIGDWGVPRPQSVWPHASGQCQDRVAQMMKDYVQKHEARGKKCLFVGSVGDNFYSMGVKDNAAWQSQWADVYGTDDYRSPLYGIPWLSVMGNHDYGNDDPTCACGGPCNQFNNRGDGADRPPGTEKYWMPDYFWHYSIPGVDLEVIGLDTSALDVTGLGGDGCNRGAKKACQICGGQHNVQRFLSGQKAAGENHLDERARNTTAKTALIMQHYDGGVGAQYKSRFEAKQSAAGKAGHTYVISAFGHAHDQECHGSREHGCDVILTGGGGGWRGGAHFGFTAVHLRDDGSFETVLETGEVRFPQNQCSYLTHNATDTQLTEVLV